MVGQAASAKQTVPQTGNGGLQNDGIEATRAKPELATVFVTGDAATH